MHALSFAQPLVPTILAQVVWLPLVAFVLLLILLVIAVMLLRKTPEFPAHMSPGGGAAISEPGDYRKYIDPNVLTSITPLDLRSKTIMEGFISGLHKSPFRGFSVEFAQHREYCPGDDIRFVDWKVFAKTDRFYIKEYEEETNLTCQILLDVSESMRYRGTAGVSKLDYAAKAAASLSHLLLQQKDAVGMVLFDSEVRKIFPASNKPSYLRDILNEVAQVTPSEKTSVGPIFHRLAEELPRRGLIMILSDLFVDLEDMYQSLKHFRFNRHEILLIHVMDEDELTFPFSHNTLFKGMEMLPELMAEPKALRRAYLEAVSRFHNRVERGARENGLDYLRLSTADHLEIALARFLAARSGVVKR